MSVGREARGYACEECGAYADRVEPTHAEEKKAKRLGMCSCCVRVFLCRKPKCQHRMLIEADAPEPMWY